MIVSQKKTCDRRDEFHCPFLLQPFGLMRRTEATFNLVLAVVVLGLDGTSNVDGLEPEGSCEENFLFSLLLIAGRLI